VGAQLCSMALRAASATSRLDHLPHPNPKTYRKWWGKLA
jgi:hypothetical protein